MNAALSSRWNLVMFDKIISILFKNHLNIGLGGACWHICSMFSILLSTGGLEVTVNESLQEKYVYDHHDSQTDRAHSEPADVNEMTIEHEPSGHPA